MSNRSKVHEFGQYPTVKGYAVVVAGYYRGWEIRRIAGGPEHRADCPTFRGVKKNPRSLPGHDIETMTFPSAAIVRRAIDNFENSAYAEGPKVYSTS
uniref:Uncharacterized protein n=1 Tax=viral metagenome TaxID=1070528 RepID=A0A6M3KZI0_9ZZZZ